LRVKAGAAVEVSVGGLLSNEKIDASFDLLPVFAI
jgi:hypothetical protein